MLLAVAKAAPEIVAALGDALPEYPALLAAGAARHARTCGRRWKRRSPRARGVPAPLRLAPVLVGFLLGLGAILLAWTRTPQPHDAIATESPCSIPARPTATTTCTSTATRSACANPVLRKGERVG